MLTATSPVLLNYLCKLCMMVILMNDPKSRKIYNRLILPGAGELPKAGKENTARFLRNQIM